MADGGPAGNSIEAEKARYRRKLAEWRAMGFDVSALEVLLETDFEKFKEKRFELMRNQIHGAGPTQAPRPPESISGPATTSREPPSPLSAMREEQGSAAISRRPGLHSHFARTARAPETPAPAPEAASRPERFHSEMRYPSVQRRRPEREVKTFSIAVEHRARPRNIDVGREGRIAPAGRGAPPRKKPKVPGRVAAGPRQRRPVPADTGEDELAADGSESPEELPAPASEDGSHIAVEEESEEAGAGQEGVEEETEGAGEEEPSGEEEPAGEEGPSEEEEPAGDEEPSEEEGPTGEEEPSEEEEPAGEEEPSEEEGPAGDEEAEAGAVAARPVKRKLKKVAVKRRVAAAPRKTPYGWIAVAVVIMLVAAALGYIYLAPRTTVTARAFIPATAEAGALVAFDGGNSTTTGKGIARYSWNFGDGARAAGERPTHFYLAAGAYNVSLSVRDQDGTLSAPFRSRLTVTPLSFTVPAAKAGDNANYKVNGTVDVRNPVSFLYKVAVPGYGQATVSEVQLDLNGTMDRRSWGQEQEEDGFGVLHTAINTSSNEAVALSGKAYTNLATVVVSGELDYNEHSYTDAATGGLFQVRSQAFTTLHLTELPVPASVNSSDTLRTYPSVAGIIGQFQPEDIYRGQRLSQSDGPDNGTRTVGNTTYYWSRLGARNIGGMASLGLHITAGKDYLDRNGFSEFYIDVWVSGSASMPTSTHLHVVGSSADTHFSTDHLTTITAFKAGSGDLDFTPQAFDPSPLNPDLFYSPFADVPAAGAGNASLKLTPEQALQEGAAKDGSLRDFLTQNPQAYAVAAKYYEGQLGPGSATWNLTFSWPNATSSYWVNVTRDLLSQYTVHGGFGGGLSQVRTAEGAFARMLSLSSAENRLGADGETRSVFFKDGGVSWAGGTSLELGSDAIYPSINLASMYASPERAGYAALLGNGRDTSAISMDTGQMMYFYTHSTS
jgi:hypothetical protein